MVPGPRSGVCVLRRAFALLLSVTSLEKFASDEKVLEGLEELLILREASVIAFITARAIKRHSII